MEQPRGHLSSNLCSTIYTFIGSLSSKKNNSKPELSELDEQMRIVEEHLPQEDLHHRELPLNLGDTFKEEIRITEIRGEAPEMNEGITFQNNEYINKVKELFNDQLDMPYNEARTKEVLEDVMSHSGEAADAIEKLHLTEALNKGNHMHEFTHPEHIEKYTEVVITESAEGPYTAGRQFQSGGMIIPRSSMKVGQETTLRGRQIWDNLQDMVNGNHEYREQYTAEKNVPSSEECHQEPTEPRSMETSDQKNETSASGGKCKGSHSLNAIGRGIC